MIYFESNINYPYQKNVGHINIENGQVHYSISSNQQQSRWFVAVSIVYNDDTGRVIPKPNLSHQFNNYGEILAYISKLPQLVNQEKEQGNSLQYEMRKEFRHLYCEAIRLIDIFDRFENKWFNNEKESNSAPISTTDYSKSQGISNADLRKEYIDKNL